MQSSARPAQLAYMVHGVLEYHRVFILKQFGFKISVCMDSSCVFHVNVFHSSGLFGSGGAETLPGLFWFTLRLLDPLKQLRRCFAAWQICAERKFFCLSARLFHHPKSNGPKAIRF